MSDTGPDLVERLLAALLAADTFVQAERRVRSGGPLGEALNVCDQLQDGLAALDPLRAQLAERDAAVGAMRVQALERAHADAGKLLLAILGRPDICRLFGFHEHALWEAARTSNNAALAPQPGTGAETAAGKREGVAFEGGWLVKEDQVRALMNASTLPSQDCGEIIGHLVEAGYEIVTTPANTPPSGGDAAPTTTAAVPSNMRKTHTDACNTTAADAPELERAIEGIIRDACELPDRSSPEGQPEMLLITGEELDMLLRRHLGLEDRALAAAPGGGA